MEEQESAQKMMEFSDKIDQDDIGVEFINAGFSWGYRVKENQDQEKIKKQRQRVQVESSNEEILKGVDFKLGKEDFLVVVGQVGAGKTTLLYSIMKETKICSGTRSNNGTIAYVEQEPFILSGTIKENILFGKVYDEDLFDEALAASCLKYDLLEFANGADTIIGERGVNISGGQKARISLARAVFSEADIYLLDDPLSAVDPQVADDIFNNCIRGILKDKCVVLVTH